MGTARTLFTSSVGRKAVVAATGGLLALFVLVHMLGNLNAFFGADAINGYAERLRALPALVWVVRLGLAAALAVHVYLVVQLAAENRAARPAAYRHTRTVRATLVSRAAMPTGLLVLAFLLFHLAHFTLGLTHPELLALRDRLGRHDVYRMLVLGFRRWEYSALYVAAVALLAAHLGHAMPNLAQSLGWSSPRLDRGVRRFGVGFALLVFAGYAAVPLAVTLHLLKLAGEP